MDRSAESKARALEALTLMRSQGLSLSRAARLAGTSPSTVRRHVGGVLFKQGARWRAKPWDRIPRPMRFLTSRGIIEVVVRDSRTASRIARHLNAVDRFLKTGDATRLAEFGSRSFIARGEEHHFLTDPETLTRLGFAGEVAFEDLYVRE